MYSINVFGSEIMHLIATLSSGNWQLWCISYKKWEAKRGGMGLGIMAEWEKKEKEEKIRWNLLYPSPCWILWYVLHCIMTCKYDKIWKWHWVGKSGLMHCFQSLETAFQAEFFSFASEEILIQLSLPLSPSVFISNSSLLASLQFFPQSVSFSNFPPVFLPLLPKDV